jgi:hypothetical protein
LCVCDVDVSSISIINLTKKEFILCSKQTYLCKVRVQVLTTASMKMTSFWDIGGLVCWSRPTFQRCILPSSSWLWWWSQWLIVTIIISNHYLQIILYSKTSFNNFKINVTQHCRHSVMIFWYLSTVICNFILSVLIVSYWSRELHFRCIKTFICRTSSLSS